MAIGSFSAALSGLNANSTYLAVIGNNLANLNTVGFKTSSVTFKDLVSRNIGVGGGGNPLQVGLGVSAGAVSPVFSQGSVETTEEGVNVAIQGDGFLVVALPDGGNAYTRAGDFTFDAAGVLVNSNGDPVQGWTTLDAVTGEVITSGKPDDIVVPPGVLRGPTGTTEFQTQTNLDANAIVGETFGSALEIVDSLGATHAATITYTNTAPGAWDYDVTVPGAEAVGGVIGTPFNIATGTVAFDAQGALSLVNGVAAADVPITTPLWTNGAAANVLSWDVVDAAGDPNLTGFASASATGSITQNGVGPGTAEIVTVDINGNLVATIGSGETLILAQLAMASFNNPKGLTKLGNNLYAQSGAAGLANLGQPGTAGRGTLIGSALEQSNVDIAAEFTKMILAQRGYQASARTITVSDEVLVETLNLKR